MAASPSEIDSTGRGVTAAWLVLALFQGLALLGLHYAVERAVWPSTSPAVLVSLYLNAALLPLTAQLLARFFGQPRLTWSLVAMTAALVVFGWHHAALVAPVEESSILSEDAVTSGLAGAVLWLIAVAFLRAQLETGRGAPEYRALFAAAWRNQLVLLEAVVLVGVLWLLLGLWAALFETLEIAFFSDLFFRPAFAYPVTSLAVGVALHLIGRIDRVVEIVLAHLLSLFKWFAPIAGLIVVLFAAALLPELPPLLTADERPLDSALLLWLVAVTVLLLNAAYQDGSAERPYGLALSTAMRFVPPLLTLIALTATYALYVRIDAYGITVGRFWGFVAACVGLAHAVAATVAAARRGPWLGYLSKTNPLLAAGLAFVLILSLTPILSPHRLSAASQQRIALETNSTERLGSALTYLRFSGGGYGRTALQELAELGNANPELAASAEHALRTGYPRTQAPNQPADFDTWRSELQVYPEEQPLPDALVQALRDHHERRRVLGAVASFALWVDVVGGPELELFLSLDNSEYELYAEENSAWRRISRGIVGEPGPRNPGGRDVALARGDFAAVPPELRDIRIGERQLKLTPLPDPFGR